MMLKVDNLDVFYGDARALDGVSLEIEEGAIVAIVGANGAGKTSLIRTIAGMHKPARGHVFFRGLDIAGWPSHKVCDLGIGQVAEGRRCFLRCRLRKIWQWAPCCRARAAHVSKTCKKSIRFFPFWPSADSSRPGHCQAANNKCLPSAAVSWVIRNWCCSTSRRLGWRRPSCKACSNAFATSIVRG